VAEDTLKVTVAVEVTPLVTTVDTTLVTPAGAPVIARLGVAMKPPAPVTVTALVDDPPCCTLALAGARTTAMVLVGGGEAGSELQAWTNPAADRRKSANTPRVGAVRRLMCPFEGGK
jgi:hypothetical protein